MSISEFLPYFSSEKNVKLSEVVFGGWLQEPLNLTILFVNCQPFVADKPPPLVSLNVTDHDPKELPGWTAALIIVPNTDLKG